MRLDSAQVESVAREQHARQPFSGVVQVREGGTTVHATAFGQADRSAGIAWMTLADDVVMRYTCSGADPGVAFVSARYPTREVDLTVLGNTESDAWPLFVAVERFLASAP